MTSPPALHPLLDTSRRCRVMGILNVTPDSFSDGGLWLGAEQAIAHGVLMREQGADLVDVGGESTRPGAQRVSVTEELGRVIPVIEGLTEAGVAVSIDTMRAEVARAAVAAGAVLINDVSGGLADPEMPAAVAELGVPYVAMHWRAHSTQMDSMAVYDDVVKQVCAELQQRVEKLLSAGVQPERIILDPGLGFAKDTDHNWQLLRGWRQLQELGYPLLVGASRKRFLGALLADESGQAPPAQERDAATAAISAFAAAWGAWGVRVHDVPSSWSAVRVGIQLADLGQRL